MKRWLRAIVGLLAFIALPYGGTAARFGLWLEGYSDNSGAERG